ncbi:DNA cytosine methylase [Pseudomonas phage PaBG]|uniref:DNA (cytosine-5-)-methyltransferase n=1 Tax=Pseudomonas phage PaBG TaxID=1335230 RepID=S5WBB0_9CAUD|nr:DNA cytosine methylase [Pseudomonas phage PaBG]AGS82053.1 DNA cytosine methylase [Pseudomonas phage PaBG]
MEKKIVKIPSMKKINALPKAFKGISSFSGCGGSSTGVKMAGVQVLLATEFIKPAIETYEKNHKGTIVIGEDIRKVDWESWRKELKLKRGQLDFSEGSPPCKSFSTSGTGSDDWGKEKLYSENVYQRTDDLFYEEMRKLEAFMPKVFVCENVKGMVEGDAKGYFIEILRDLKAIGYSVKAQVLNAARLDVPQARERVIFVGVRNDLVKKGFEPVFPKAKPYEVNVNDVLPHIAYLKSKYRGDIKYVPASIPSPTIVASDGTNSETAGFSSGGFIETVDGERRKYTIDELKKIFTFPDDFIFTGTYKQQFERLGRSVPPLMMYRVVAELRRQILEKL